MITYVWPPQSVAVAVPPVQYLKNGANQTVIEDTVVPANNNPLPAGLYIIKDGVIVPVLKDTGIPSNTVGIPVEVVAASGTPINITAGDINVQLSDQGVNFDSLRLGDGSGVYLVINPDGSINVADMAAVKTAVEAMNTKTPALVAGKVPVDTGLTQALTDTQLRANPVPVSGTVTANVDTSLLATIAKQDAQAVLTGAVTETAPASDTASSGLNGRLQRIAQRISALILQLPATLGQKTSANSLGVVLASDQSTLNTTNIDNLSLTGLSAGALNADLVPSTDVSKYSNVSVQVAGTFVGTLTFQGSNDNSTWSAVNIQAITSGTSGVTSALTTTGFVVVPVFFKYFRVRMTAYTSGSATGAAQFAASAPDSMGAVTLTGTSTVQASTVAGTITSAQIAVGTTAVRATVAGTAPNAARKLLIIKPSKNNSGNIYFGPSGVTAATGMEIIGPDPKEFDFDAGDYFVVSDTAAQTVEIVEKV
jgi:hypothetical protein